MGKIKKILENELLGGTTSNDVYPVTSTQAVYDENNRRLSDFVFDKNNVVNDLTTGGAGKALSAEMGKTIANTINNIKPVVINGNVANAADEEDITSEDNLLKLKDRTSLNGMGYIILRKGKSFKEQLIQSNTIYEIRYDFDLDGETVEIPENCMLEFQGGSLINGVIVFNNTKLYGFPKIYCNYSGSIKGDINVLWFGVDNEGVEGVSDALQTIIDTFSNKTIYFPAGNYIIDKQVKLPKSIAFAGNGDDSILELRYNGYNFLLDNHNNEGNYAVTIKMRNLRIIGTYPSWYDADADSKKTECSFLHVKATAYTYYSLFEDINVNKVKFGITIDKCYWSRFSNVRFYDYEIGLDLAEANSSSISGCTFRGGFDRGLIFRRSHNEPSAGIGVSVQGNDFSGNNYCGMQILGQFTSSSIIGNYFESEPGYQIIVGGKDAEQYNTPISLTGSLIKGNGGLWAAGKKGIRVYGEFSRNDCDAAVYFEEGSSGRYNTGCNEVSKSKAYYNEMWSYDTKYRQGILDYWDSQIKHNIIENICIPANSEITIDSFTFQFFKFLYFKSLTAGVTLIMYAIGDPGQYIVGTEEKGQASMEDENPFWKGGLLNMGGYKNCIMKLRNTTDKNVVTNIEVKYFCNIYGK